MAKSPTGKGGNIDTRPNPFGISRISKQTRPDVATCPSLLQCLDMGITAGAGFIIAGTRDGGALCITVLEGDTRHRTYCSSDEELEEAVASLTEYFTQP